MKKIILKLTLLIPVTAFVFTMSSCAGDSIDKKNDPVAYDPIGGYANSDEIAASNLVGKFSFENNLTDTKEISTLTSTLVGYNAGVKGYAWDGSDTEARYAVGTTTSAITSLNNFTLSFWMNSAGTVTPATPGQGKGAQGIFSIVRPSEFWGGINVFLENPDSSNPDRLRLKIGLENGRAGVAWRGQGAIMNIDNKKNQWIHIVFTYNATTSTLSAYLNGDLCSNLSNFPYAPAEGSPGYTVLYASDPGDVNNINNAPKYGAFEMVGTNNKILFGNHQFQTDPTLTTGGSAQDWATSYVGKLDEFRVYNTALSASDIKNLYLLETQNR